MKYIFVVIFFAISTSTTGLAQEKPQTPDKQEISVETAFSNCSGNSDIAYNRQSVLKQLAKTLNETATSYYNARYVKKKEVTVANVNKERPVGFFVYDLIDVSNEGLPLGKCVEFKNNHIYHFALIHIPYSFSHLAILEGGNLKVFKAINCSNSKDNIEDVIKYLNPKLKDLDGKEEIINRVKLYRNYGIYNTVDDPYLRCQQVK